MTVRWKSPWTYAAAALGLASAAYGAGLLLGHVHNAPARPQQVARAVVPPADRGGQAPPQVPAENGDVNVEGVVLAQRKRVMGRLRSLQMVRQVATKIRPLVDRALEMPEVQADLRALAQANAMSLPEYKKYFAGKEEADLMLESGGDPNAWSSANAIGVAQFLAGTGQRCGLKVNGGASMALSRKIWAVENQIEWLQSQPSGWAKAVPASLLKTGVKVAAKPPSPSPSLPQGASPEANAPGSLADAAAADPPAGGNAAPASTEPSALPGGPGTQPDAPAASTSEAKPVPTPQAAPKRAAKKPAPMWTRDQWLDYRIQQWRNLVAQRCGVDERFDPAKAIRAQAKYLVGLARRYGGVDWALQAYHGGEAGASKTMNLFTSAVGPGALLRLASRGGGSPGVGAWLPYSEFYAHISPLGTPDAFSYLFGRSDDHRYYWWKVLMAERALNLYRKDPKEFEHQWRSLRPGLSADAAYYPDIEKLQYSDNGELRDAYRKGELVGLPHNVSAFGVRTANIAVLEPESAPLFKGLRPETMGALLRLAHIYRSYGGASRLTVLSMVETNEYRRKWDSRYPQPPPPPRVPKDPEYHTAGTAFDLQRPTRDWDRKVLEYAMGRLYDTLRISWRPEVDGGSRRYHIVVNPEHRKELVEYYRKAAR